MTQVHAIGHMVVLVIAFGYAALGLAIAAFERVPPHAYVASLTMLAGIAFTAAVGILSVVLGNRPSEAIHWLYGLAMMLGALASIGFSTTMAPRPRGLVMLATASLLLLLTIRLGETG